MNTVTCKTLGITGTDADLVMGDAQFIELCKAGEAAASEARAYELIMPSGAPAPAREKSEWETLKLRGNDCIESDEVVIAFKRGREVRMSKTEWASICERSFEPHTIAARRLA